MKKNFIVDFETPNARITTDVETPQICKEIHEEFIKEGIQVHLESKKLIKIIL